MAKRKKSKPEKLDIKEHVLVPKHEKCSEAEKKYMLQRLHAEAKDLPKINVNDSALADLDVKPGDVVKITRDSATAGESIFYRVVIEI